MDDDPIFDHHFSDLRFHQNWCCFWPFCPPCTAGHGHGSFASHGGMLSGAWPRKKTDHFLPWEVTRYLKRLLVPNPPYKIGDPTWPKAQADFRPLSEWPIQRPPQEMPWWNPGLNGPQWINGNSPLVIQLRSAMQWRSNDHLRSTCWTMSASHMFDLLQVG